MSEKTGAESIEAQVVEGEDTRYRHCRVEEKDFSEDTVFQVAAASEFPVERRVTEDLARVGVGKVGDKFLEVLSHEDGDADLSRFNGDSGAAFLDEHFDNRQLGHIRQAILSKDKKTRAVVQLHGLTKLSRTRTKEIRTGERKNVSMGYKHTRYLGASKLEDGRVGHRFAWQGLEISSVAVGADPTSKKDRKQAEAACFRCGDLYARTQLEDVDGALICKDCRDAEDSDDMEDRKVPERVFRAKSKDGKERIISHSDMRSKLSQAMDSDKRFKTESKNGDKRSDFYIHDLHQIIADGEVDDHQAIVSHPAWSGKYFKVDFSYDHDGTVELGDAAEVEPKTTFESVERGLLDGRLIRADKEPYGDVKYADPGYQKDKKKRYPINTKEHAKAAWSYVHQAHNASKYSAEDLAKVKAAIKSACKHFGVETEDSERSLVDSEKFQRAEDREKEKRVMPKTATEIQAEAPEAVREIRSSIETEYKGKISDALKTRNAFVGEITKRCDEFIKDHGMKKRGELGETLRKVTNEFLNTDHGAKDNSIVLSEFGQRCLSEIAKVQPEPYLMRKQATDKEYRSYSVLRGIQSVVKRCEGGAQSRLPEKSFELDVHEDMVRSAKEWGGILGAGQSDAGGFWVPSDAPTPRFSARMDRDGRIRRSEMVGDRFKRDLFTGDFGSGGALVPTELMTPIIEPLRNWTALDKVNTRFLGGLSGNIVIPRQTGTVTPQAVSEIGALVASQPDFDQISARPKRIGNQTKYSKQLIFQSSPDVEALIRDDNFKMIALQVDEYGIAGTGANSQPLGVINQPGVFAIIFGGTATIALIESMATKIRQANIREPLAFLTTSNVRGRWRSVAAALVNATTVISGQQNAIWTGTDEEGLVTGRPAHDSQQIPFDQVIAGAWDNLIWFQWAGIEVVVDPYTQAGTGEWLITMNTYNDFAVRHPQAFCVSEDSGAQ